MPEIMIDPVTRIEGHLAIKVKVENEKVVDAHSSGMLWRGFERIVVNRDPRDAPIILSRICGVCHSTHRITSTRALEDAADFTPPDNAIRIRNIIQGITCIYSHAAHLLVLAGPDYGVYGLAGKEHPHELELDVEKYYKLLHTTILPAQRMCHEALAIFGGKVPHHMTTLAGGVTVTPTPEKLSLAYNKMLEVKDVVGTIYNYVHETLIPHLIEEHIETVNLLLSIGVGVRNFLAWGVYPIPEDNYRNFLEGGVIIKGEKRKPDPAKIVEHVKHSWYTDESGGNPAEEIPPEPQYGKPGAYSWIKAPRYEGLPCEVGPQARMIVAGKYKVLSPYGASLLDRLLARLEELKLLVDVIPDWIMSVKPEEKVYSEYKVPETGFGIGLWEAPRGALAHFVKISNYKTERYQAVVPTTWNASPRDGNGVMGPIENSLIGTPVPGNRETINVLRIVRSYDPCLACSIHLVTPKEGIITKEAVFH